MKILSKEIDVVAAFAKCGNIVPIKFRIDGNIVKVDKINLVNDVKFAGEDSKIFRCQSYINNTEKLYELKFVKRTCTWYLYKM